MGKMHNSDFDLAMVEYFDLDPAQVSAEGFTAEYAAGNDRVYVTWKGSAFMPLKDFMGILEGHDAWGRKRLRRVEE